MSTSARLEGYVAQTGGSSLKDNPYYCMDDYENMREWERGWWDAYYEEEWQSYWFRGDEYEY